MKQHNGAIRRDSIDTTQLSLLISASHRPNCHRCHPITASNLSLSLSRLPVSTPIIRAVCPSEGPTSGATTIVVVGDNFFEGLQVVFGGSMLCWAEFVSPHALKLQLPARHAGPCDLTLSFKGKQFARDSPGRFVYTRK